MKPTYLIFNSTAGAAAQVSVRLERFANQMRCELLTTKAAGDAARLARAAVQAGAERLIVAGGDGTISQVVNGLAPDFVPELAIVPLGTGNDLARSLDVPSDSLEVALSLSVDGHARAIDVIRVVDESTHYLINAATGGFGGKVAADLTPADKLRWGALAYWTTAVRELTDLHDFQIDVTLDGFRTELTVYGIAVANGRYVGGGFPIAPWAWLNDGWLDVTIMPVLPTVELLAAGMDYMLGIANETGRVPTFRARRVRMTAAPPIMFSIDGEPIQELTAAFEIVPGALRVVVGESPALLAEAESTSATNPHES